MKSYYVRILSIDKKNYKVQWIDGSVSQTKIVHKHMIDDFKKWKSENKGERPKLSNLELKQEIAFIEQLTKVCGKKPKEEIDTIENPLHSYSIWCQHCHKWYATNCFKNGCQNHSLFEILSEMNDLYDMNIYIEKKLSEIDKEEYSTERTWLTELALITKPKEWLQDAFINEVAKQQESKDIVAIDSMLEAQLRKPKTNWDRLITKFQNKVKDKKLILIPFNEKNEHWRAYLIVIDNAQIYDFDSFHTLPDAKEQSEPHPLPTTLIEFLKRSLKIKSFKPVQKIPMNFRQTDSSSCGVFVANWLQTFKNRDVRNKWIYNIPVQYKRPSTIDVNARFTVMKQFLDQVNDK